MGKLGLRDEYIVCVVPVQALEACGSGIQLHSFITLELDKGERSDSLPCRFIPKKDEIGRACSTYGARRGACRVLEGKPERKSHFEDPGVDGRIILKYIFEKWYGGMEWIDLAQDRDRWRAVVNAVMNI
jgi:Fe-S-cluster containining protein